MHIHMQYPPPRIPRAAMQTPFDRHHVARQSRVTRSARAYAVTGDAAPLSPVTRPSVTSDIGSKGQGQGQGQGDSCSEAIASGAAARRLPDLMRELNTLDREQIGAAIDAMIACLDARDGDPDNEDADTGGELMIADGEDYDPALDHIEPDGLAGDPIDAEEDDPAGGAVDDVGEAATWIEQIDQTMMVTNGDDDLEPSSRSLQRAYLARSRVRSCRIVENPWGHRFQLREAGRTVRIGRACEL